MSDRQQLIAGLSRDLTPVKPLASVAGPALAWALLSALYVVGITHLFGPLRPTAFEQLATQPRFLAETALGVVALVVAALIGFRAAVPGALTRRTALAGLLLVGAWVACYVFGLVSPALEPSMLGKRPHCVVETFLFALPPLLVGLLLARRWYPLEPVRAGLWIGLTAGLLPALYMQLACMYIPRHILAFHIAPGLAVAALAAPLAWLFLSPRWRDNPERGD
jgi:hypothetical protein